jgi:hypothetical protein
LIKEGRCPDPLDAALGRCGGLAEGVAGEVR